MKKRQLKLKTGKLKQFKMKHISFWDIWIFIISFFLIIPDGLNDINPRLFMLLYNYGLYFAFVNIIVMFVFSQSKGFKISISFYLFMLFFAATIMLFLINGNDTTAWKYAFSVGMFTVIFTEANKNRIEKLMNAFQLILELWIYANFILMFVYPWGMYYFEANQARLNWILGYKSSLQYYILPAVTLSWIKARYKGNKIRHFILISICIFEVIYARSSMILMGLIVIVVFQFSNMWIKEKLFNIWKYYLIVIMLNIAVVFMLDFLATKTVILNYLTLLGKDATLSHRASVIWPKTIEMIRTHIFLGNGLLMADERAAMYGGYLAAIHSHNQLMEILFIGGLFLFAFYLGIHIYIGKQLDSNIKTDSAKILAFSIFVLYIMMTIEVFNRLLCGPIWFILYLACFPRQIHSSMLRTDDNPILL